MKFRPAGGLGRTLEESMKHVREVKTKAELMAFLRAEWLPTEVTDENVTIEKYGDFDKRIGWDTHLLCIAGKAALFTDGPMPPDE
jgi:hypothetical protein